MIFDFSHESFIPFPNWKRSTAAEFASRLAEVGELTTSIIFTGSDGVASVTI